MPLYEFHCDDGTAFEAAFSMADVPGLLDCPSCGMPAKRLFPSPRLSIAGASAYRLIDASNRSAHIPEVVSSPGAGSHGGRRHPYTSNPLHQKLPRP